MTVLFLYTELADYFLKCCEELSKSSTVHIVRWPVNKEAPFDFNFPEKLKIYDKNNYSREQLKALVVNINPSLIVCSGWVDKDYLSVTRLYFGKIPTMLTCDTHWKGSLKQRIAVVLSRVFLLRAFSHAWVPGETQKKYMRKLGFKPHTIKQGFYCCDLSRFNTVYEKQKPVRQENFPKRFLFVGRYYAFKGIADLWEAFIQLQNKEGGEWELWCLGAGDIEPVKHAAIKHFGFVQPGELDPILEQCGVFVLPSRFEPWGVVVQEYAASGFPLLLSKEVGAGEAFLQEEGNGYSFEAGNVMQLKQCLKKIMNLDSKDLLLMSEKSHLLAQKINQKNWVNTLQEVYNGFKQN